jgi:malate dehydrogenase (oxaloacetate-decarboxylating)
VATPSASYSATIRLRYANEVGMFSRIAAAIAEAGGDIGAIDIVEVAGQRMVRDVTVNATDDGHAARIVEALRRVPGVTVVNHSDRTFLLHLGGKIEVRG